MNLQTSEEKLINLKRKLLEKRSKVEAMLFELQEINKTFNDLRVLILKSEKVSQIRDNTDYLASFDKLSEKFDKLSDKISTLELKPEIIVRQNKVEPIFDPKIEVKPVVNIEKTDVFTPIKWLKKASESFLTGFFSKVISFMGNVLNYIKEPDRVVISDTEIVEYYGNQKKTYRINESNNKTEITYES